MRNVIPEEKRVATALWKLGTGECYRGIGLQVGEGKLTVKEVVNEFVESLLGHFNVFIRSPDTDDKVTKLIDKFTHNSVDGTHIEIKAPKENPGDYYNRSRYHSVLLQGIADRK